VLDDSEEVRNERVRKFRSIFDQHFFETLDGVVLFRQVYYKLR
jgi:hypothetical protein